MIFELLATLLSLYSFVILARLLLSWVPDLVDPYHPAVQLLRQVTDPVLEPARQLIPPIGMIDISATIVLLVLWFLVDMLRQLGRGF
ncbi:MAG: YggT family protein [Caldilineaceae bacterium]|nr:YggT family protein [Caldilineaceae bacterium]